MTTRRELLRDLGLLSVAGLLPLSFREARAATRPKRVVLYVTSHGTVGDRWSMVGGPGDAELDLASTAEDAWSPILLPLYRHRRKLCVLDGLANVAAITTGLDGHAEGHVSCLTGRLPLPAESSLSASIDGPSIDQVIAATRATPIRSLEYSAGEGYGGGFVNFDDQGAAIPYETDPIAAWDRLFASFGAATAPEPTTADRIRARQARVLDAVAERFDALAARVGAEDRVRLEQHRDLLRDLERQVEVLAELACEAPDLPVIGSAPGSATYGTELSRAFFDLTVAAFSCGLTEVVTIRSEAVSNEAIGAPPGDLHADFAHAVATDPAAADVMTAYHTWNAERLAELLDRLDAVPDGEGTLLDATLVVWTNELATGDHTFSGLPVVLAGAGDVVHVGRAVRWEPVDRVDSALPEDPAVGPAHNRLLTTVGVVAGLDIDAFGERSYARSGGGTLSATGTLDRVLL